jgi:hypothetical protein
MSDTGTAEAGADPFAAADEFAEVRSSAAA